MSIEDSHFGIKPVNESDNTYVANVNVGEVPYDVITLNPQWQTVANSVVDTRGDIPRWKKVADSKRGVSKLMNRGTFRNTISVGDICLNTIVTAPEPGVQRLDLALIPSQSINQSSVEMLVPFETDNKSAPDWEHFRFIQIPTTQDKATPIQFQLGKILDTSPKIPARTLDTILRITTLGKAKHYLLRANYGSIRGSGYGDFTQTFSLQVTGNPVKFSPQTR